MIKAWRYRKDGRDGGSLLSGGERGGFGMEGVAENKAGYFALRAQHSVDDMKGGIMGGGSLPSTRGGRLGSLPSMGYARGGKLAYTRWEGGGKS